MELLLAVTKHYPTIESLSSNDENCQGDNQEENITLLPFYGNVRHPCHSPTSQGDTGTRRQAGVRAGGTGPGHGNAPG